MVVHLICSSQWIIGKWYIYSLTLILLGLPNSNGRGGKILQLFQAYTPLEA